MRITARTHNPAYPVELKAKYIHLILGPEDTAVPLPSVGGAQVSVNVLQEVNRTALGS